MTAPLNRRQALSGVATAGLGVPLLAACGDDGGATADPTGEPPSYSAPPSTSPPAAAESSGGSGGLVATADVEVGGGVILDDVVVTQPAAGQFKGFGAICTHNGCKVATVSDGAINCLCHGSRFSIEDGSVQGGPAKTPLPEVPVQVSADQVVRG